MSDATALNATARAQCDWAEPAADGACGVAALVQALSRARVRALHPMAPVIAHLCLRVRRHDAADPDWPDADRLLACGPEGVAVMAAVARLLDAEAAPPEPPADGGVARGGQGVAMAAGMAWAERGMAARFGRSLADHRTWALTTAEELVTGLAMEAAHLAGEAELGKLTLLAEAPADASLARGYAAIGFLVRQADAGDAGAVAAAFTAAQRSRRPTLLLFAPAPGSVDAARAIHEGADVWALAAARGSAARRAWRKRLTAHAARGAFEHAARGGFERAACGRSETDDAPELLHIAASPDTALTMSAQARRALGEAPGAVARGPAAVAVANGIAQHGGFATVSACLPHEAEAALPALRYAAAHALPVCHLILSDAADGDALHAVLATVPGLLVERPDAESYPKCLARTVRRPAGPTVLLAPPGPGVGPGSGSGSGPG